MPLSIVGTILEKSKQVWRISQRNLALSAVTRRKAARNSVGVATLVPELAIMIPMVVLAVFFLMDTGLTAFYRNKLDFILEQVGQILVQLPDPEKRSQVAMSTAKKMFLCLGLDPTGLKIDVKQVDIDGYQALKISALANFKLLSGMDILPTTIKLQDAVLTVIPANRTEAIIAVSPYPYSTNPPENQQSIYIPVVAPRPNLPVWQFPFDESINRVHLLDGGVPDPRQNAVDLPNIPPSLY